MNTFVWPQYFIPLRVVCKNYISVTLTDPNPISDHSFNKSKTVSEKDELLSIKIRWKRNFALTVFEKS